mmetsp:Transcript_83565/g.139486  ORF Transcript_83565/g.139486 Transcript_83565/m.139486 type:complete len:205 (+) Transcript_83565:362-976(+)
MLHHRHQCVTLSGQSMMYCLLSFAVLVSDPKGHEFLESDAGIRKERELHRDLVRLDQLLHSCGLLLHVLLQLLHELLLLRRKILLWEVGSGPQLLCRFPFQREQLPQFRDNVAGRSLQVNLRQEIPQHLDAIGQRSPGQPPELQGVWAAVAESLNKFVHLLGTLDLRLYIRHLPSAEGSRDLTDRRFADLLQLLQQCLAVGLEQ